MSDMRVLIKKSINKQQAEAIRENGGPTVRTLENQGKYIAYFEEKNGLSTVLYIADLFEKDKSSQYFLISEILHKYYLAVKKYEDVQDSDWPIITIDDIKILISYFETLDNNIKNIVDEHYNVTQQQAEDIEKKSPLLIHQVRWPDGTVHYSLDEAISTLGGFRWFFQNALELNSDIILQG